MKTFMIAFAVCLLLAVSRTGAQIPQISTVNVRPYSFNSGQQFTYNGQPLSYQQYTYTGQPISRPQLTCNGQQLIYNGQPHLGEWLTSNGEQLTYNGQLISGEKLTCNNGQILYDGQPISGQLMYNGQPLSYQHSTYSGQQPGQQVVGQQFVYPGQQVTGQQFVYPGQQVTGQQFVYPGQQVAGPQLVYSGPSIADPQLDSWAPVSDQQVANFRQPSPAQQPAVNRQPPLASQPATGQFVVPPPAPQATQSRGLDLMRTALLLTALTSISTAPVAPADTNPVVNQVKDPCKDWKKLGNCEYKKFTFTASYDAAMEACAKCDAKLAHKKMKTAAERTAVFDIVGFNTGKSWIGMEDQDGATPAVTPKWLDGASYNEVVDDKAFEGVKSCAHYDRFAVVPFVLGACSFNQLNVNNYICEKC